MDKYVRRLVGVELLDNTYSWQKEFYLSTSKSRAYTTMRILRKQWQQGNSACKNSMQ